jgi:predicted ATPase
VKVEYRNFESMTSVDVGKSTIASDDSQPTIIGDTYYQSAFSGDGTYAASAEFSIDLSTETNGNFSKREGDMIISEVSSAILASSFTNRKSETVENLTVNKLRYSSLGLHGRDKEKEILNTCLVNVAAKDNNIKRAMVFIKGFSGTGKSALSESMMARTKSLNGLYIKGKFDLHLRDEPYSGIAAACRGICGDILMLRDHPAQEGSSTGRSFQEIHDKLIDGLGAEIHLLTKVIPELSEIVGDQQTRSETEGATEHHGNQQEAEARFNYIFRGFIRVITSYFAPLVMVLDDLQWADVGSLELMDVLITDRDTSNFMIIGLYRSNEVDDYHIMSKILRDLKEKSKEEDFDISEIELGNLGVDEVNCVIMDLLSLDDSSKAIGLAEICHKRTLGNAFFLIAFIAMLREEGLLDFNLGLFKWVWDVTKIESETGASSNVVDLMKRKMTKSPADFCQLLSMAACLGSSFDVAKLGLVWNDHCQHSKRNIQHDDDNTMLEHWLSLAIEEGYLDRCGACDYQWSHDKVQEAAFSLVSAEKLGDFKFRVGDILLQQLSEKECDDSIFVVVNLLYEGSASALEDLKRIRLAELHLQASQKAAIFSAFSSSAKFARRGIDLLPGDRWTNHCELTLDLFSTAAESYGYLGNVDSMESFCNEVLKQDIPLLDKLRVYNVLVSSMTNSGRHAEAAVLILEILRQLGCKFPKSSASRSLATLASLAKARATLNSRTPEEIAKMPTIKDSLQIETMKLLGKLATCSHLCGSNLALLPIMRKIRLTLRYGLCEVSPPAFAALGAIMSGVLGDLQAGSRIGDYSLLLLAKVKSKHTFSRTTFILFRYVFSSTRPFRSLFKSFLEGYGNGLTSGDNESALLVSMVVQQDERELVMQPHDSILTIARLFVCSALHPTLPFRFCQEGLLSCSKLIAPFTASK